MGYSLLFVDDDNDTRALIERALSLADFEVVVAASANEALQLAAAKKFDVYLLDNWLPEISGVELCLKLRETDSECPIVFLSGAGRYIDKVEALSAGANAYLTKPIDLDELVQCLNQILSSR
jgi:DNA-binding response OmpR family regulator